MKAPKCFLLLGSLSMKRGIRGLAFGHCCLLVGRTLRCQGLFWPRTSCYLRPETPSPFLALVELYPLAFSSWCPAPVVTRGIHCVSSTWSVVLVYTLASLLHGGLGRVQKTCSRASSSSLFWCIYYSARLFHLKHSYDSLLFCHGLFSTVPVHRVGFGSKLPSALLVLQLAR